MPKRTRGTEKKPTGGQRPPDTFLDTLRTECARAAVEYLRAGVNIKRPISSLTKRELEGLAEAVTARWVGLVSQRVFGEGADMVIERRLLTAHDPGPVSDEYAGLLM